jgi:hypothetical protein
MFEAPPHQHEIAFCICELRHSRHLMSPVSGLRLFSKHKFRRQSKQPHPLHKFSTFDESSCLSGKRFDFHTVKAVGSSEPVVDNVLKLWNLDMLPTFAYPDFFSNTQFWVRPL